MLSFLFSFLFSVSFAQEKVQVKTVTPQGFVKSVSQVRIEFSQPMVRFGDIKLDAPATSECFKNGQGRWIDTRNWVYDFNEALPGGAACTISAMGKNYSFNTGGPHIKETFPLRYRPIDPEQSFVLFVDSPVKKESINDGVYFVVEGLGDRIPAKALGDSEAKKIKEAAQQEYIYEKDSFKGDYVVVKADRAFAPGSHVSLVWSKKVQSASGASSKEDEVIEFTVAESFKAEFSCEREAPEKPCIPLLPMRLSFSSPISVKDAKAIYLEDAGKKKILVTNMDGESSLKERISYLEFKGPFAQNGTYKLMIPSDIKDEDGRRLSNESQFPLTIKTGENPSLLKFAANFGIVEAGPEAAMAVTLRRVEKNIQTKFFGWSGKIEANNFKEILKNLNEINRNPTGDTRLSTWKNLPVQKMQVQKPNKAAETEVVGIPLKKSGFYIVEMESPLLGQSLLDKKAPFFVRSAALVTDMAVHVKYSNNEAWVWVTELKSAKVVPGAAVKIYDVTGNVVAQATTDAKGLAYVQFKKSLMDWPRNNEGSFYDGFFAVAEKGDDFSFTHSSWDKGIESWRYQLGMSDSSSSLMGHAILDRTLLKPEETLSAKIVLRKVQSKGLGLPSEKEWPTTLNLSHDSGLQSFKLPLQWDKKKGVALLKWTSPAGVKMGRWTLTLEKQTPALSLSVGEFAIESFRVPLIQVRLQSATPSFVLEKNIPIQISGTYFSGGPTVDLPMKMRWSVEPSYFNPEDDDFQDFTFANGGVKEGLFRSGEDEGVRHIPQSGVENFQLNKQGAYQVDVKNLKYGAGPQKLRTEAEYKDPNGEIQSVIRSFTMWPSSVVLGIKAKSWWATPNFVEFDVVALDLLQKPLKGQKVTVDLYTSRYYSHRKRLVGGFYAYEDFREYKKIGELCSGETNSKGVFNCAGKSKVSGSVLAVVTTKDSQGRQSIANVNQWIVKPGETQWFGSEDNDRADLIPFKKTYEPGEVAEFQLRTPFPEAKVLVTVERDTVLYSEVIDVKGDRPVIRVPIKKEYAPNVVVSAFAIRGRLNDPKPTALVDLGKPAFKLGMTNIKVGWKENTLKVTVNTDRKTYKAREKSLVTVSVKDASGKPAAKGEVALVAVDEGLLELRDNHSWDILSAMMRMRPHTLSMATAQSLVIGKRHFGLKAVPIGGDGGGALRRELFDTLLYWNPSVTLNAQGQAKVEIPLNDSTTSFRIVAVALQGADQFGTGWTSIQSSQDLMILPGLSGVTREGDDFLAGFTIRNASKEMQNLDLSLNVTPKMEGLTVQKMRLNPGEAKEVHWKIRAPQAGSLEYVMTAKNEKGKTLDEIKKVQKVLPVRVARIYQSEWGSWPDFNRLALQQPAGAEANKSSVVVELSEGLGGSQAGIKEFWKNYEYTCLEQQVSRAISLNDKKLWQKIESKLNVYLDSNGLLRYFPSSYSKGSVNLTAYVLTIAHEAGFKFTEETENRMLEALNSYAEGKLKEETDVSRADDTLKKITAFEALSRFRRLNIDLLTSIDEQGNQWPLYTLVEWYQIHLWEKNIPQREKKIADLEALLRSRFYFSAKRLQLKNEERESMPWLMRDSESSILRLILATMSEPSWKSDTPRLYQGVLSRQKDGAWYMTTDNAWGSLTMRKVQAAYSKEKVQGTFQVNLGSEKATHDWSKGSSAIFELPWKEKEAQVQLEQKGAGKPWVTVSAKAATPVTKATFAGFKVEKTVSPVEQKTKGVWSVGDVAKIKLKITSQAPQTWVVVEDPVPGGATVLQSSWATAVERKEELIRFYFSWFTPDNQEIEYTVRFNQAGNYVLPVTRVEAMYSPDLFAELPESSWTVKE
ncbi:alpha-2-macroglobulin family protein [Bdellovibrio sp. BCCA]|uniref:alpha-2-macroglobulin family protein n=1 Tax=Bdellovibrio sp. BCCA TaxID=3136281 RepID=UPI0030F0065C